MHHSDAFIRRLSNDATISLPLSTYPGTAQREKFLIHLQSAIPRKFFGTFASTLAIGDLRAPSSTSNVSSPGTSRNASQQGGTLSPNSLQRCEDMWDYEDAIIIREIYEGECPEETFERELDRALEAGCKQIVIEPARLGEETARWIRVGDCLHKCTILFGLSSICLSITPYHSCSRLAIPFTMGSVFCGGLYMICWQSDPCCKYRLARITEFSRPGSTSYIDGVLLFNGDYDIISNQILVPRTILLRKDQDNRKYIQTAIVTVALALAVIRFYT